MSNPYAAPSSGSTAPGGRRPGRGLLIAVLVGAVLVVGGVGAAVWALTTSLPDVSVLDAAAFEEVGDEETAPTVGEGVDDPWRRGDLTQGLDGGTFQDPWPMDGPITASLWTVELSDARVATDEILAAAPGNTPPYETNEYWMVHVEATYTGPDQEIPPTESVHVSYLSDAGTSYSMTCGVVPDEFDATGFLTTGTTIAGNVCVSLPAATPGSWSVSQGMAGYAFLRAP